MLWLLWCRLAAAAAAVAIGPLAREPPCALSAALKKTRGKKKRQVVPSGKYVQTFRLSCPAGGSVKQGSRLGNSQVILRC